MDNTKAIIIVNTAIQKMLSKIATLIINPVIEQPIIVLLAIALVYYLMLDCTLLSTMLFDGYKYSILKKYKELLSQLPPK